MKSKYYKLTEEQYLAIRRALSNAKGEIDFAFYKYEEYDELSNANAARLRIDEIDRTLEMCSEENVISVNRKVRA